MTGIQLTLTGPYEPWSRVEGITVPTPYAANMGLPGVEEVFIQETYAATLEDVLVTAQVAAFISVSHGGARVQRAKESKQAADEHIYQQPLTRLICPECGDQWDAWVDEDGHLEDQRDLYCSDHSPVVLAMEIIEGEEQDD